MPDALYERVVEVEERVVIEDNVRLVKHTVQCRRDRAVTGEQVGNVIIKSDYVLYSWLSNILK